MRALNDREKTPERLAGMTDAPARFRAVQDLSDSEGEEMDEDDSNELPTKRRKVDASSAVVVTTKWSNPDPYTTLPPVDENRAKRVDVVQLIRKAKVNAAEAEASKNAIAENNDFVPLDFGSDGSDDEDDVDHRNEYPFNASSGIPFDARPAHGSQPATGPKRKRPGFLPGNVVDEWAPVSTSETTPWLTVDHSATEHMGFW
jgi:non-canonical poly(A) RNA polymerase PAPD5/7